MGSANRLIVSILVVTALAVGFWILALSPKREQANELAEQVEGLQMALTQAQSEAVAAAAARRQFPTDYRQLVVLGQAVPDNDETASLLVELNRIADKSRVRLQSMQLSGAGEAAAPAPATTVPAPIETAPASTSSGAVPAAATVPPTEMAASLLPLGATIGPAGLDVMPYELTFQGDFFHIADFIKGLDSLVHTGPRVAIDGRLITINGFSLSADAERGFPHLAASFSVTTYLTPPSQGLTAGATAAAPAAAPVAETPPAEAPVDTSPASEPVSAPR